MTLETHNPYKRHRAWRKRHSDLGISSFSYIEKMFYYYKAILKAVQEVRKEQGYYKSSTGSFDSGGGGSMRPFAASSPTVTSALRHCTPIHTVVIFADKYTENVIKEPEKWLTVVEQTLLYFEEREPLVAAVLRRRFLDNEPLQKTCEALAVTRDKFYRLRDIGIHYARECAIQLGLVRVF